MQINIKFSTPNIFNINLLNATAENELRIQLSDKLLTKYLFSVVDMLGWTTKYHSV